MKFSNRLRVLRADRRISQMDLALEVGMGRDRLWRIENGYTEPTEDEMVAIANALGAQVDEAFPQPQETSR